MIALVVYFLVEEPIETIIVPLVTFGISVFIIVFSYTLAFRKRLQFAIIFAIAFMMSLGGLEGFLYDDYVLSFISIYVLVCFQSNRYKVILCAGVCTILPLLIGIIEGIRADVSALQHVDLLTKLLFFITFFTVSAFKEEKDSKRQFLKQTKLKKEFKKSKMILNILLPDFVRERIRTGQRFISEDQGVVTIIFVDMVDFDDIVSMHQPGELIEFLDKMYNAYDQMCNLHSLQKIETVGKSYMACGGLKAIERKSIRKIDQLSTTQSESLILHLKS